MSDSPKNRNSILEKERCVYMGGREKLYRKRESPIGFRVRKIRELLFREYYLSGRSSLVKTVEISALISVRIPFGYVTHARK